jgi:KAP family P-loop domain
VNDYKILLDDPAQHPTLGFDQYARAFAGIIRESEPRFAIGIFGNWGSGKTTLMQAIQQQLAGDPDVITLWFNAWRYEREEHLIVPMLDTLREALLEWAEDNPEKQEPSSRAKRAAATVARAARAILVGMTLQGGMPGALELSLDASRALADWHQEPDEAATEPQSFYHASFTALQRSLTEFVGPGEHQKRIVVFVDDLDRCLPTSALQVLESMKLFFDLSGFVFVVGLDRQVVEGAIEAKYGEGHGAGRPADPPIKGTDYIKKIFQVPFTLPSVSPRQLNELLRSIASLDISKAQREDLWQGVQPHLVHLVTDAGVNPREVKRYLNAYTLQRRTRPKLDPDVILCLQTMEFRADWKDAYDTLLSEREVFIDALVQQLGGVAGAVENLWPELAVDDALLEYLRTPGGQHLLEVPSLEPYLHSAGATRSTQPGLMESYRSLGKLRGLLRTFDAAGTGDERWQVRSELLKEAKLLLGTVTQMSGGASTALLAEVEELSRRSELPRRTVGDREGDSELNSWRRAAGDSLARIQARLRRLRDSTET